MRNLEIDKITSYKAMELLGKDGIIVDQERAEIILNFLYEIAEIVVTTYLTNQKNVNLLTDKSGMK